jgi:hypothetical protein
MELEQAILALYLVSSFVFLILFFYDFIFD